MDHAYSIMISCETLGQNIGPHCWWGSWAFKHLTTTSAFTSSNCLQAMVCMIHFTQDIWRSQTIRAAVRGTAEMWPWRINAPAHPVLSVTELKLAMDLEAKGTSAPLDKDLLLVGPHLQSQILKKRLFLPNAFFMLRK